MHSAVRGETKTKYNKNTVSSAISVETTTKYNKDAVSSAAGGGEQK